jgi:hypothetical protein
MIIDETVQQMFCLFVEVIERRFSAKKSLNSFFMKNNVRHI